ncbi:tetratricopeptide repeat protein 27-like [Anopheles albimanus]|uniref:tetratricopeptide repeat protein 27-like n=1 Tax=Anopheles albimanus TaxID=7167 RepID=UPI001640A8A9|nr:tetratricopeptide repeat protein 27-like [Anopheles albimanus]
MQTVIFGLEPPSDEDRASRFYQHLCQAEWNGVIGSATFQDVLEKDAHGTEATETELLHLAIAALLGFVEKNFLGPRRTASDNAPTNAELLQQLKVDGEELNVNVERPDCLLVCKRIFHSLIVDQPSANLAALNGRVWYQRYLLTHQRCIDDLTHGLYGLFNENASSLETYLEQGSLDLEKKIEIALEILLGYVQFKRITKSEYWATKVEAWSNVKISVEGLLGVRTKFQQNPLPQLTLRANGHDELGLPAASVTHGHVVLPTILKLDDEVRLDKIKFLNESENEDIQLPALIQNILLSKLKFLYVSQPKEQLTMEELNAYVSALVYQCHGPWATRVAVLYLNAANECTHKRTVDRSLRQLEELVQLIDGNGSDKTLAISAVDRLSMAFSSWLIPYWELKVKLADVMVSLGMIKGALDVYLSVESWENVIDCYTVLELRHKAATIIKQLMEQHGPSVRLYCMLGDATDDVECYRAAWELSGETSARAQRHWGNYYFARKDYATAIGHLRRSIEINSLQEPTLLRLGYAALQLENWEEAAHAYRLYTSLESHGFESWNNLAKAYIKLGEKSRAHKILQEALKCNYNNWMVWENYLLVSVDTRNYEDALNAYERLMELKEKYYDQQVLDLIVRAIVTGENEADGQPCSRLRKKAIKLLGHACAQRTNNGYLYALAAELEDTDLLKRCQKLQNAYRGYTQSNSQWSKAAESCLTIVTLCVDLCEYSLRAYVEGKGEAERFVSLRSQLSSARLTGQGCFRSAKSEDWPACSESLDQLEALVNKLTAELKSTMEVK